VASVWFHVAERAKGDTTFASVAVSVERIKALRATGWASSRMLCLNAHYNWNVTKDPCECDWNETVTG
jgi:hypothetical protein